jgi:hypothetical protein
VALVLGGLFRISNFGLNFEFDAQSPPARTNTASTAWHWLIVLEQLGALGLHLRCLALAEIVATAFDERRRAAETRLLGEEGQVRRSSTATGTPSTYQRGAQLSAVLRTWGGATATKSFRRPPGNRISRLRLRNSPLKRTPRSEISRLQTTSGSPWAENSILGRGRAH